MPSFDALIVGGGPAGSTCALALVRAGADVCLLDKREFPRDKPCAGWITPQVVDELELDAEAYRRDHVLQPITGFRTGLIGGEEILTTYDQPVSFGIRRCEFDHYLLNRSGAKLRLGAAIKQIERKGNVWVLNGELSAPVLVGAGGHFCPVARQLGARRDHAAAVVAAQEVEFAIPPDRLNEVAIGPDTPELLFCPDLAGYGWCFRKGDFLNVGLGRVDRENISGHVQAFCNFLRERKKIAFEIPARFKGHAYQLYERVRPKLVDDGVLLIGDAAGLAYPQSGEGIRPAVESALLAARVIAASDTYDQDALQPYAAALERRLGKPRSPGLTDSIPASWLQFVAGRLMATRWFTRRVVLEDWFLHRREPSLSLEAD